MEYIRLILKIPLIMSSLEKILKTQPIRLEISSITYEIFDMELVDAQTVFTADEDLESYDYYFECNKNNSKNKFFDVAHFDIKIKLPDFQPSVADLFTNNVTLNIGKTFGGMDKLNELFVDEFLAGTLMITDMKIIETEEEMKVALKKEVLFSRRTYEIQGTTEVTNISYEIATNKLIGNKRF